MAVALRAMRRARDERVRGASGMRGRVEMRLLLVHEVGFSRAGARRER